MSNSKVKKLDIIDITGKQVYSGLENNCFNEKIKVPEGHFVETYKDHRMALAFAALSIATKEITINNPEVITKSYPDYWENLKEVGFKISYK